MLGTILKVLIMAVSATCVAMDNDIPSGGVQLPSAAIIKARLVGPGTFCRKNKNRYKAC